MLSVRSASTCRDEVLDDLRRRLAQTRWPEAEPVDDWSQGAPLAWIQDMCRYWGEQYDWRAREARLNRFDQFVTTIDGLDIHFVHQRSPHPDAKPLVITHGWPGSIVEFHKVIEPLTDPTEHGGDASDAFHVICPTLPGFGFSGKPTTTGWGVERIADAWAALMARLGYDRYFAQGGDWGSAVTRSHRRAGRRSIARQSTSRLAMGTRPRVEGEPTPEEHGRSRAPSTTRRGIRATPSSRRRARRPSGTDSPIHRRDRPRGSWRSSGRGPIATAIPRTSSIATSCSTT